MPRLLCSILLATVAWCTLHLDAPAATPPATKPATRPAATKPTSKPVVAKWTPRPYPQDQVNLLAMGDWGSGGKEQKDVAKGLAAYAEKFGTQFNGLLSVGDNFYVQLKDEDDYQFQSVFEDVFDAKRVNFPFYAAFGNHDYEKNKAKIEMAYALKHPDSRWKMPARWYRLDFPSAANPVATILVLDSNKPQITPDDWLRQTAWIDQQLAQVRADKAHPNRWTIACAHHPLFSNGAHGDNGVLQVHWGPVFKKHKLDFYVCGHDHDLQQLQMPDWPTSFILAGGGGKRPTKMRRDLRGPFSKSINGFSHLHFTRDLATVGFVNAADSSVVHEIHRTHDGKVDVVVKGGNDKASSKPLRVLLGLDDEDGKPTKDAKSEGEMKDKEKDETDPDD